MAQFLSAAWVQALDHALRAEAQLGPRFAANPIAIAEEVTGDPPVRYVIVLDGSGGRVDEAAEPDVTFVCDRATAAGLATGSTNAQTALTSGRLKLRGDVDRLGAAGAALAGLGDVLATLRAATQF